MAHRPVSPAARRRVVAAALAGVGVSLGLGLGLGLGGPARTADRCDLAAADARRAGVGCAKAWMDRNLKLNDLMTVGTHNSYKAAIPPAELAVIAARAPKAAPALDYGHRPLAEQLDAGVRQIELDVYLDPQGGLYAHPRLPALLGETLDPAWTATMSRPGLKVMHVPDIDFRSICPTFVGCLSDVKAWSVRHPDHAPIMILINAKDENPTPGGAKPPKFDAAGFDAFDAELRSVFAARDLITPDQVQGAYPTLREAATHDGWPTLGQARGKIFVVLDETPEKVAVYRGARRSLQGRAMFVSIDPASPAAAYLTLNDPLADRARIGALARAGLILRTRADAETVEARANDTRPRDSALSSGAWSASTDYVWPDPRFKGGYRVGLPGGAAVVCNPVRAREKCAGLPVELADRPPGFPLPENDDTATVQDNNAMQSTRDNCDRSPARKTARAWPQAVKLSVWKPFSSQPSTRVTDRIARPVVVRSMNTTKPTFPI